MATAVEYALMAGASYISTRPDVNKFPVPDGWVEAVDERKTKPSGFEATYFTKANEIVISFAGTDFSQPGTDFLHANIPLAAGIVSDQLRQAADYYLQVKASAPAGATISLTGHSLGGGLAALIGVFFGETAFTFDQAPFRNTALQSAQVLLDYLSAEKTGSGAPLYTPAQLQGLTNFIQQQQANSGIPNEGLVTNLNVQGEIVSLGSALRIGNSASIPQGTPFNPLDIAFATNLHSEALLTALLQSNQTAAPFKSLSDVTVKLPDLLKMVFDSNLFAHPVDTSNTQFENFLERLVKHEAGVRDPATGAASLAPDQMVTRFTEDLWKLAKDGGLTLHDQNNANPEVGNADLNEISKALTAFAMQFYYEDTANATDATKELFTSISGGIQFDLADVSKDIKAAFDAGQAATLNDAKGYELYFSQYFLQGNSGLSADETAIIQSKLPTLRDWYIQAGSTGMIATDTLNQGDFMLGGAGADSLGGGDKSDLLVGNDVEWRLAA
jgi:hypothetical protein